MNILLLFFALPVATIILAIVLQKILKCPILVAATFFAIFLIVTFAVFDASFLVFAIVYTILAFLAAAITQAICRFINNCCSNSDDNNSNCFECICGNNSDNDSINDNSNNNSNCCREYRSQFYPAQNYIRRSRR